MKKASLAVVAVGICLMSRSVGAAISEPETQKIVRATAQIASSLTGSDVAVPQTTGLPEAIPATAPNAQKAQAPSARESADQIRLQAALKAVFPALPADEQEIVRKGLQFVVSYKEPDTSVFPAWGPEDDSEYKYPDRTLYPQGTIKINISLLWIEGLGVAETAPAAVKNGLDKLFYLMVVHEIEHALQYSDKPVLALGDSDCPGGLCDAALLAGTKLKIQYETQAMEREFAQARNYNPQEFDDASQYLEQHQEILTPRTKNIYKLLRKEADNIRKGIAVSEKDRVFYDSEYAPAEMAREYLALKARSQQDGERGRTILAEVGKYFDFGCAHNGVLTANSAYLVPVFDAVLGKSKCPATP